MQAVIYTTSSLAPKNLLSFFLSLSFICQLKQRVQVEDSKVLEGDRANTWKEPGNLKTTWNKAFSPPPHPHGLPGA